MTFNDMKAPNSRKGAQPSTKAPARHKQQKSPPSLAGFSFGFPST
jgi:hypothetical protein